MVIAQLIEQIEASEKQREVKKQNAEAAAIIRARNALEMTLLVQYGVEADPCYKNKPAPFDYLSDCVEVRTLQYVYSLLCE